METAEYKVGMEISFSSASEGADLMGFLQSKGIESKVSQYDRQTGLGKIKITEIHAPKVNTKTVKADDLEEILRLAKVCKNKFDNLQHRFCFELVNAADQERASDWTNSIKALINKLGEVINVEAN